MPANNMSELVERYGGQLKQALARNCLAVRVSVHGVTRERTISESKVTIDDKPVEDEFQATGKVKLVPQEIATALDRIANRARNLPARYGVRMPGMYLVPIGADDSGPAAKLFRELAELRTEYRAKAQEYAPAWEAHIARLKVANPKLYESVGRNMRTGPDFIEAHAIDTMLMPLAGIPDDLDKTLAAYAVEQGLTPEAAARVVGHMRQRVDEFGVTGLATERMTESWAKEAAKITRESLEAMVETMLSQPIQEFDEALAGLEAILNKGGAVKRSSIEKVQTAYQKLTSFGELMPTEIKDRLKAIEGEFNPDRAKMVSGARNHVAAQGLSEMLKAVREDIQKVDSEKQAFLGAKRILRIDD